MAFPVAFYNPRVTDDDDIFDLVGQLLPSRSFYDPRELRSLRRANNLAQQLASFRDTGSEVQETDKGYCVTVDAHDFKPEEIKITCDDKYVTVTAKHEEREDKRGGFVKREMTRKFLLPNIDPKSMTSTLNNQGLLRIRAARQEALEPPKEVNIPVEFKGC